MSASGKAFFKHVNGHGTRVEDRQFRNGGQPALGFRIEDQVRGAGLWVDDEFGFAHEKWGAETGCRSQPGVSKPGPSNQLSVVGSQLSGGI